jgi:hypothetical protein
MSHFLGGGGFLIRRYSQFAITLVKTQEAAQPQMFEIPIFSC